MAYTDLTTTFGYKVRIDSGDLGNLNGNDADLVDFIPFHSRASLEYRSATEVIWKQNGTDLANANILFPDGSRGIGANNPIGDNFFDITKVADWTDGDSNNHKGGLRPGLSEASNTWYALFSIKTVASGVVLVGDTTLPIRANVNALNTRYGQNRWVYHGLIRNGDNGSTPSDILDFIMTGRNTFFRNLTTGTTHLDGIGIIMADGTATSLTLAYSAGTGATDIPDNIKFGIFSFASEFDTVNEAYDSGQNHLILASGIPGAAAPWRDQCLVSVQDGVKLLGAASKDRNIFLNGFQDNVLGLGYEALI